MLALLPMLASPLGRAAAIGALVLALLAGGVWYLHGLKQAGVEQGRAEAAAAGEMHQQDANRAARVVDDHVARTVDPMAELRAKGWVIDAPK